MKLPHLIRIAVFALACAFAVSASAQWQWIDKDGRKVFSDRAPPPEVPKKNILTQPGNLSKAGAVPISSDPASPVSGSAPAVSSPTGSANTPRIATADKELEAKKKQVADAETAKRKADEEKIMKARIENCARAKQARTTYDSGVRVARTNAAGEREVMDDATRAAEVKRIQAVIDSDCK